MTSLLYGSPDERMPLVYRMGTMKQAVAVKAVKRRGQTFLLIRRSETDGVHPGLWDLPGGRLEIGEFPRMPYSRQQLFSPEGATLCQPSRWPGLT
jgi:8-oxo-dGTP pyrophosphatase MutT (NUDIX family)